MKNKTIAWVIYFLFIIITGLLSLIINMDEWWCVPFSIGVLAEGIFLAIKDRNEN